jgi:hypothetical protein
MKVAAGKEHIAKVNTNMNDCNNFRYTIWKSATSVSFAVKDSWVVAWVKYQTKPGTETFEYPARETEAAFGTPNPNYKDTTLNTANILRKCLENGYNGCIANTELAAHNHARLSRTKTGTMVLDKATSKKLQELMNDTGSTKYDWGTTTKWNELKAKAGTPYTNCV